MYQVCDTVDLINKDDFLNLTMYYDFEIEISCYFNFGTKKIIIIFFK